MAVSNYDRLAPVYDSLARIVFGNSIRQSQLVFLDRLKDCRSVLVLGGGTGWWLRQFVQKNPSLTVTFIDASHEMIQRARTNASGSSHITFIHGTEESIPAGAKYDAVILFYFVDLFDDNMLNKVLDGIKARTQEKSIWLIADFGAAKRWHRLFLRLLYSFFRVTTQLKTSSLPQWQSALTHAGLVKADSTFFYRGFIESCVYQSQSNSDQMLVE